MRERTLSALKVSAVGLGCMGMTSHYGTQDLTEARATIAEAVESGVTLFDTAASYGDGANESLLGDALSSVRDHVVLATKLGARTVHGKQVLDGSAEHVRRSCEDSLRRLRTEYIDLLYLHRVDPKTPIESTWGAMKELVAEGKVRYLGLSEAQPSTIRRAHRVHPVTALQSEWSLWTRELERDVVPLCSELGVGIVPFAPLGRGLLAGSVNSRDALGPSDIRSGLPRFEPGNLEANLAITQALQKLAALLGRTPSQLCLAWLLSQNEHVVPIPGTKNRKYLKSNLGALDFPMTPDLVAEIEGIVLRIGVHGERYPAHLAANIDQRAE